MAKGMNIQQSFVNSEEEEGSQEELELKGGRDQSPNDQSESTIEQLDGDSTERLFDVDLTVKLQPVGEKAIAVPLVKSRIKGGMVKKILDLALDSRRNQRVIDAVLDLPEEEPKTSEGIKRKGKQKRG